MLDQVLERCFWVNFLVGGPYLLFTVGRCCGKRCPKVCAYVQLKDFFWGDGPLSHSLLNKPGAPLGNKPEVGFSSCRLSRPQVLTESFFDQLAVSAAASSAVLVTVGLLIWFSNVFQHALDGCWL